MRLGNNADPELDDIDLRILEMLQADCRTSLARIGEAAGLSAPAVLERIKKLETAGVITGYRALLDARLLGLDITAFIGVIISHPTGIGRFESQLAALDDVLECHHVTGEYTLLLKVKTANTSSLEALISRIRSLDGVARTETMVVLSTHSERVQLSLHPTGGTPAPGRRGRRNGDKTNGERSGDPSGERSGDAAAPRTRDLRRA
jgi:Lrp/AsnC family transcriptional regulator, leucine-responsive regulatory protein